MRRALAVLGVAVAVVFTAAAIETFLLVQAITQDEGDQ